MSKFLKQNQASNILIGPFIDETDGITPLTSLEFTQAQIQISKNGATANQTSLTSPSETYQLAGMYALQIHVDDAGTVGTLDIMIHKSGALPVINSFMVIDAAEYNRLVGGTGTQVVDVASFSGTAASQMNTINNAVTDEGYLDGRIQEVEADIAGISSGGGGGVTTSTGKFS